MSIRVGLLSIAHLHAEGYQANLKCIEDVDLVGFSHENPNQARSFAEKYGLRWFHSEKQLLAEDLDGVVICAENANHLELVEMAASAKCDVLCEKPIATTVADAEAMRNACEENGVRFMTAFPMRFAPSLQLVRSKIKNGELGEILGVNGANHSEVPTKHRAWFADKKLAGGGAVMDHTVHLADLLRWHFSAEIVEVYAELDNFYCRGESEVETAGLLLVTLSNGVHASIDCSWSRPSRYPRWGHLKMEILGEKETLVVDGFAEYLTLYSRASERDPSWVGFAPDPNQAMMEEFAASIRQKRDACVSWNDGYQALRVALAAYESANEGAPVTIAHGGSARSPATT
jgi:predicted dehydrogenase